MAPHHGLESCYSEDLYKAIRSGKPKIVAISERRKSHEGDGITDQRYCSQKGSQGMLVTVDGKPQQRHCITTKNGHHILIVMSGHNKIKVFADKDPINLLEMAD